MVDWSIFWNNIFPGLILIISSSVGAYIVVHRYQRKKHAKEIRDDLIKQEHELLNKYWIWMTFTHEILTKIVKKEEIDDIKKKSDQTFQEITNHLNLQILEEDKYNSIKQVMPEIKKLIDDDRSRLLELRETVVKEQKLIKKLDDITFELLTGTNLLLKRLINQLGLKVDQVAFFENFSAEVRGVFNKIVKVKDSGISNDEKKQIKEEANIISKFFLKAERLILKSKIKF